MKKVIHLLILGSFISCAPQKAGDLKYNENVQGSRSVSAELPANVSFEELSDKVLQPLNCLQCHKAMGVASGFNKYVKAGEPFDSKAYLRMENQTMPPFGTMASSEQLDILEAYIRSLN